MNPRLTGLQTRDFAIRAETTDDGRTITAIGVPYNVRVEIWPGFFEEFAPGSVTDEGAILRYAHREPLGTITDAHDTEAGREITGHISKTQRGDEVATLLADGVLTRMSIGFEFDEYEETKLDDGGILIRHIKARAREYSIVEFPAYDSAQITDVRSLTQEKDNTMGSTTENPDLTALRTQVDDLERALKLSQTPPEPPRADTRSLAQVVKAIAQGDPGTIEMVNQYMARDYTGGTISDDGALKPVWVKDLSRIIDTANPLAALFAKGTLPAEGMTLEFTQLKSNTVKVDKQEKEGDPLTTGKVSVETKSANIETFGGANTMSFQEIQRARTNMVALTTKAMAIAAGKEAAASFHTFYEEQVKAAQSAVTISKAAADLKWVDLLTMVLDVAKIYRDLGLELTGSIVDRATFLALGSLEGADGRPLMQVTGTGTNTVGQIDAKHFKGELSGLSFVPDFDSTLAADGISGAFYHSEALRVYTSGIGHLQDDSVLNLTRDMSIYYFAAHAAELPSGLVQLKFGV